MLRKVRYVGLFFAAAFAGALNCSFRGARVCGPSYVASTVCSRRFSAFRRRLLSAWRHAALGINTNWATIFFPSSWWVLSSASSVVYAHDLPRRRFGERSREACRFDLCCSTSGGHRRVGGHVHLVSTGRPLELHAGIRQREPLRLDSLLRRDGELVSFQHVARGRGRRDD